MGFATVNAAGADQGVGFWQMHVANIAGHDFGEGVFLARALAGMGWPGPFPFDVSVVAPEPDHHQQENQNKQEFHEFTRV
jgi:hypothetical protein